MYLDLHVCSDNYIQTCNQQGVQVLNKLRCKALPSLEVPMASFSWQKATDRTNVSESLQFIHLFID